MKLALTDRFCSTIKCASTADFFDAKTSGLALRVSATGVKSWALFYTVPGTDKRARKTLGQYPVVGLSKARTLAMEAKGSIAEGTDPRTLHGGAMTVSGLVESYLAKHLVTLKSGASVKRRLMVNVLPVIGGDVHHGSLLASCG